MGDLAPEALAWSPSAAADLLAAVSPVGIVCLTARAFHPSLGSMAPIILDYVDSLAGSYAQRAGLSSSRTKRAGYSALSRLHSRIEANGDKFGISRRMAAGRSDAEFLGAEWFPILAWDFRQADPSHADHDFVFAGNLGYLPNIEAVEYLAQVWPEIRRQRAQSSLLIAGRRPAERVVALARKHSWTLVPDFKDALSVVGRGRVALAPVEHLSGISTKILDAAAMGVPQLVTPAALKGVQPDFPVAVAGSRQDFASAALELLSDEPRRRGLARAGRELMIQSYSVQAWIPWGKALLEQL